MLISAQPIRYRSVLCNNNFGKSKLMLDKKSHDAYKDYLKIPIRQNPHENSLRWYPRLQEQREKGDTKKRKYHVTFGNVASTKVRFGLF